MVLKDVLPACAAAGRHGNVQQGGGAYDGEVQPFVLQRTRVTTLLPSRAEVSGLFSPTVSGVAHTPPAMSKM